jgi:flagellar biosynthesis/type III secretory pathway protein FliH
VSNPESRLEVSAGTPPNTARVLNVSLAEYSHARRSEEEERLRAEGFAEASNGAAASLEQASQALEEQRSALLEDVAQTAAALAVDIAQVLLRTELSAGNYDLLAIVREALAAANCPNGATTIRLNPVDVEALAKVPFRAGTQIQPDPAVRRGDVQVSTQQGLLVREIDVCVATIRDNLEEAVRSC